MEHSRLLKFLKIQRLTPEMADSPTFKVQIDYQNPENVEAEVPGSQEIREVDNNSATSIVSEVTEGDYTLSPVITVTKNEATFTKGDMKLQKVTVTEDISIEESQNGGQTKISRIYQSSVSNNGRTTKRASSKESMHEGTSKVDKQCEERKSKIPMLKFKQTVEKVQNDRKEQKKTENAAEKRPRKSSIPKLRKETKLAVKKLEADHKSSNLPPDDEFEKIYEAIGDDKKTDIDDKVLVVKIDDPEKLESKFEELIHSYDEENHEENAYTRRTVISKIPALRRKNFDSNAANRLSSLVNNIRLQNSVRNSRENEFGEVITKTITTKRYSRTPSRETDKNLEIYNNPDNMPVNTFNKETKSSQVITKTTTNTDADNIEQDAKTKEFITTEWVTTDTIIGALEQNEVTNAENIITHITINPTVIDKDNSINITNSSQTLKEINRTVPVSTEVRTVTRTISKTSNNLNDIDQDNARSKVLKIEGINKENSTYSNQEVIKFEKVTKVDTKDYYSVNQNDNNTDNREFITTQTVIKSNVSTDAPVVSEVTITKIDDDNSNINIIQDDRKKEGIMIQKSKTDTKIASTLLDKLTDIGTAKTDFKESKYRISEEVTNVQITEISKDKPKPTAVLVNNEMTVKAKINPSYQNRVMMGQDVIREIIKTDIILKDDNKIDTLQQTDNLTIESDTNTGTSNPNKLIVGTNSQVFTTESKEGIKIGIPQFTKEINDISTVSDKHNNKFDQNDEIKDEKGEIIIKDAHTITTTFTQVLSSNNQENIQNIAYKWDTKNNTTLDIKRDKNTFSKSVTHKNMDDIFIDTNNMIIDSEREIKDKTNSLVENQDRGITETTVLKGNVSRLINKLSARENQKETNTVNHERVRRLDKMISDFNNSDHKNVTPQRLTEECGKTPNEKQNNVVNTQATTEHSIEDIIEKVNTQISDNKIKMEIKDAEISQTYAHSDKEKSIEGDVSKLFYKKKFDINETISNEIDAVNHERKIKLEKIISDLNKVDYKKGSSKEFITEYVANEQGKDHSMIYSQDQNIDREEINILKRDSNKPINIVDAKTVKTITNRGFVADFPNVELKNDENNAFVTKPILVKSHDTKETFDTTQINTDKFINKNAAEYAISNRQKEDSNINVTETSIEKELLHTNNIVKEKGIEMISIKEELIQQTPPTPVRERDTNIIEDSLICGSVSRLITKITTVKSNELNRTIKDFEEELPKKNSVLSKIGIFESLEPKEPYPKGHIQQSEKKLSQLVAKDINFNIKPRIVDEIVKDEAKSKLCKNNDNDISALKDANEPKEGTDSVIVNEYWKTGFSKDRKIQAISVSSLKDKISFENYDNKAENCITISNENGALSTENVQTNISLVTNEDNIRINDIPTENSEEIYARIKSKNDMYEQNAIEISRKLSRSETREHDSTIHSYNVENTDELVNEFKFEFPISKTIKCSDESNAIEYFKNDNKLDKQDKSREEFKRDKSLAETDLGDAIKGQVNRIISRINSVDFDKIDVLPRAEKISVKEMPRKCSVLEKIALFEGRAAAINIRITTGSAQKIIKKISSQVMTDEMYQERINELESAKAVFGTIDEIPSITLGNGAKMPVIAFGTALLNPRLLRHVICTAIDLGYRAIDTAYIYGNEKEIGESIKAKIDDGTVKREDLFIVSKLWSTYHRPDLVEAACKASLQNLGLSYFDLYLIHNPMSFKEGGDPIPKIATVLQYSQYDYLDAWFGMEKLLTKGLVKSIGVSNFNSYQIQRILDKGRVKPVVNQVECHPYLSQRRLHEFCAARNITLSCYGVLGSKGTPTEYKSTLTAVIDDPLVQVIAHGLNVTPAQLLIRYQIQSGHGIVVKSSSGAHLWDNLQALKFTLTDGQVEALHALNRNKRTFTFMGMGDTHKNYPFVTPF